MVQLDIVAAVGGVLVATVAVFGLGVAVGVVVGRVDRARGTAGLLVDAGSDPGEPASVGRVGPAGDEPRVHWRELHPTVRRTRTQ
jgi:hypothetical protein